MEQEQIRNLYKKHDGTYSCYMCKKCKHGPIDHMACGDLTYHQVAPRKSPRKFARKSWPAFLSSATIGMSCHFAIIRFCPTT